MGEQQLPLINNLFSVALAAVQLKPDPIDTACLLQQFLAMRGSAEGNSEPGCAWTGDLHGHHQIHRCQDAAWLVEQLDRHVADYLLGLGFKPGSVCVHIQRSWPVISEPGQLIGRHHHPNAHLSAVYYLSGNGSGKCGALRLFNPNPLNELIPGMAVGGQGPLEASAARCISHHDVAAHAGLLLLFPARLDHAVLENCSDNTRFSISFDLVLTAPPGPSSAEYLPPQPSLWAPLRQDGNLMP